MGSATGTYKCLIGQHFGAIPQGARRVRRGIWGITPHAVGGAD